MTHASSQPAYEAPATVLQAFATLAAPQILATTYDTEGRSLVVLAYTGPRNCQPFVTWAVSPPCGYYAGHYYASEDAARADYARR